MKQIKNEFEKNKVIMLHSNYERNEESRLEVRQITENEKQSAKVLISTSVMNNGISLNDIELRNIILLVDTKVEFIQMLGRKREDNKKLNVFIRRRDKSQFAKRSQSIKRILKIARIYIKGLNTEVGITPRTVWDNPACDKKHELEQRYIQKAHRHIMRNIANGRIRYEDASKIFNIYHGTIYLNMLAVQNLENLYSYYQQIIERLEEDEDAFLREQLGWIGKKGDEAERIITESKKGQLERSRDNVIVRIEREFEPNMKTCEITREKNLRIKKDLADDLLVLFEAVDESNFNEGVGEYNTKEDFMKTRDKYIRSTKKCGDKNKDNTGEPISVPQMEFLHEYCGLPYIMETLGNGKYSIKKIE